MKLINNFFKFTLLWVVCFFVRMLPFRAVNFEPIMSVLMPLSKKSSIIASFFFGSSSMFLYDLIYNKVGSWTIITCFTYGIIGVVSHYFFRSRSSSSLTYLMFSVVGTILYDFVTGLGVGVLIFKQTVGVTLMGQIPFTINHLVGNMILSVMLSPIVYMFLAKQDVIFGNYFCRSTDESVAGLVS